MLIWLNLVGGHGAKRAEHASDSLRRIPTERRQEADGKRLLLTPRSLALPPARKSGIQMQPVNSRLVYLLFLVCLLFFSTSILIYHPLVCSNSASYVRLQFFSFACTPHFQKGFDGAFFFSGFRFPGIRNTIPEFCVWPWRQDSEFRIFHVAKNFLFFPSPPELHSLEWYWNVGLES